MLISPKATRPPSSPPPPQWLLQKSLPTLAQLKALLTTLSAGCAAPGTLFHPFLLRLELYGAAQKRDLCGCCRFSRLSADDCRQSKHNSFWLIQLSPPTQGLSGALCTIPRLALVEDVQMKCLGCMDHFPRGCKPPSPCAGAAGWEWGSTQPCSIESHKVGNDL